MMSFIWAHHFLQMSVWAMAFQRSSLSISTYPNRRLDGLIEEDRVVVDAMGFEGLVQFGPDRVVTVAVLGVPVGVDLHQKGFANHSFVPSKNVS
jgi:hypothetical protein